MTTEARLARLERSNRRMKGLLAGGGIAVALIIAAGANQEETPGYLRARSLGIVNDQGVVVASFRGSAYGATLAIMDATGKRASIFLDSRIAERGNTSRILLINTDDGPKVDVVDARGETVSISTANPKLRSNGLIMSPDH